MKIVELELRDCWRCGGRGYRTRTDYVAGVPTRSRRRACADCGGSGHTLHRAGRGISNGIPSPW